MSINSITSNFKTENEEGFEAPSAGFTSEDKVNEFYTFPVYNKTKQFYFKDCKAVSFFQGSAKPGEDHGKDYIFTKEVSGGTVTGYMEVPAGIEVVVNTGYVKCAQEPAVQRLLSEAAARA